MSHWKQATFGGGCFWCTEAIFLEVKGVIRVVSGYTGGAAPGKPTYREVCSGLTGHAEVIQLTYDEQILSYESLLIIFMTTHDPTQLNQQGADVGTQYRSVIFFHDQTQKEVAKRVIEQLTPHFDKKIVTEISPLAAFYEAEKEHQNYYNTHRNVGYCTYVIHPKLQQLRALHSDKLQKRSDP